MREMIEVIVRGSSDASAVKAAVNRFFQGIITKVTHMGGLRRESFWSKVLDIIRESRNRYLIVITGKRDLVKDYFNEVDSTPNSVAVLLPKANVRNATLSEIAKYINYGKAKFRMSIEWLEKSKTYRLKADEDHLLSNDILDPLYDAFIVYDEGTKVLSKILNLNLRSAALLVRRSEGIHDVYVGDTKISTIRFNDIGLRPQVLSLSNTKEVSDVEVSIDRLISLNSDIIHAYEDISLELLRSVGKDVDVVIVPWSGGKDSTSALILSIKAFGRDRVTAVYVDTGVDFEENREYIERVSSILHIDYVYVRAPIREELELGRKLPTHENRWCTALKKLAVKSVIHNMFRGKKVLIVLGDRDAESITRAKKPFVEMESKEIINVYPLKMWSALHTYIYIKTHNIPLNTLYEKGFYRIGCYICPALRSWELFILLNDMKLRRHYSGGIGLTYLKSRLNQMSSE